MRRQQLRTTLNVKLQQRLAMTPSLLQKIELLTLNRLELSELLQQELAENPVLEEAQERPDPGPGQEEPSSADVEKPESERSREEFDYEYFFGEYMAPSYQRSQVEAPDDRPSFESFLASSTSLSDHLNWQLNLLELEPELAETTYYLVGNINQEGYLTTTLEEVCQEVGVAEETAEQALEIVQSLDPAGVGCRDLQECLLIQVRGAGLAGSMPEILIRDCLPLLQAKRYKEIARRLSCDLEEIREALETLRQFTPRPGQQYGSSDPVYIQPDVSMSKDDGEYKVEVADDGMPKLRLNRAYRALLRQQEVPEDTKSFIKDRMRAAMELLKSIDQREQTIYRVCKVIVRRQADFLDSGLLALKPMLIKDVAEELGVHSSTISRVVSNKYALTPQGIVELRKFFSVGVEGADGMNVSTLRVKQQIRQIIENEDNKKPFSDQKISKMLNLLGIQITRRTVAKYRDQMNIAGSRDRKMAVSL